MSADEAPLGSRRLFVGNVDRAITADVLRVHFERFGAVQSVQLVQKDPEKAGMNYAFVTLSDDKTMTDILKAPSHLVGDKKVQVQRAVPRRERKLDRKRQRTTESPGVRPPPPQIPEESTDAVSSVPSPAIPIEAVDWHADAVATLGREVGDHHRRTRPTDADRAAFEDLVQRVRRVVWKVFKLTDADKRRVQSGDRPLSGVTVEVFGSRLTGLWTVDSDADLTVCGGMFDRPDFDPAVWTASHADQKGRRVCMTLTSEGGMAEVLMLHKASVPVIKFLDPLTGLRCDLTFNNRHGLLNSRILKEILDLDDRLHIVVSFLKHFAQRQGIHDSSKGYLNSYALTIMALRIAQSDPRWLPDFPVSEALESLSLDSLKGPRAAFQADAQSPAARDDGELGAFVVRFFEHYGHGIDWATHCVSLRAPNLMLSEFHANQAARRNAAAMRPTDSGRLLLAPERQERHDMVVEDFVDLSNVCRTVTAAHRVRIRAAFMDAYNALVSPSLPDQGLGVDPDAPHDGGEGGADGGPSSSSSTTTAVSLPLIERLCLAPTPIEDPHPGSKNKRRNVGPNRFPAVEPAETTSPHSHTPV